MMNSPGRERRVSDDEILDVFHQTSEPVLTTREVGDSVGLSRRGTLHRLNLLREKGILKRKKIGSVGAVWWHPDAIKQQFTSQ